MEVPSASLDQLISLPTEDAAAAEKISGGADICCIDQIPELGEDGIGEAVFQVAKSVDGDSAPPGAHEHRSPSGRGRGDLRR